MKKCIQQALFIALSYKHLLSITALALGLVLEWPPGG
jgi:hypothetical protein